MTPPQLSPEQRQEADKIFKASQWKGWRIGLGVYIGLILATDYISGHVFHKQINAGIFGGMAFPVVLCANWFAARQVRNAGLSLERVEQHPIPKTTTSYNGPPLEIHSDSTQTNGAWGLAVLLPVAVLLTWLQRSGHGFTPPLALSFFCVLGVGLLQAAYLLSNPPVLRLDVHGVSSKAQNFWTQRASWSNVREAEYRQRFDYKGQLMGRQLIFHTLKGRAVVIYFLKDKFSQQPTDEIITTDEIIAQVEAILTGESKISGE